MNEKQRKLVCDHMPLANKIAWKKSLTTPRSVAFDDLKSAAYMGLVDAAIKFDFSKNCAFSWYARIRIYGEIQDYLKSLFGFDIMIEEQEKESSFDKEIETKDFFDFIESCLSLDEGKILRMYYVEGRTLKEIGKSRGVSESRISQLLGSCHKRLKICLAKG